VREGNNEVEKGSTIIGADGKIRLGIACVETSR
jgi:hypothetical protein